MVGYPKGTWSIAACDGLAVAQQMRRHWDDAVGRELLPELVARSGREIWRGCGTHGVYVKEPLTEHCQAIGEHPIGVRGVDANSGDYKNTKYHPRLAAK